MFRKELIKVVDEPLANKKEVIEYMSRLALDHDLIGDAGRYTQAVFSREAEVSTAVGNHIAIPHGESDTVNETFVSCLKLKNEVAWDENEKVSYVFMIGVPEAVRQKEHIRILAMLSRHLMREDFRNQLEQAASDADFYQTIRTIEEENRI